MKITHLFWTLFAYFMVRTGAFAQPALSLANFSPIVGSAITLHNARSVANIDSLVIDTGRDIARTYDLVSTFKLAVTAVPNDAGLNLADSFPTTTYAYQGGVTATSSYHFQETPEAIWQIGFAANISTSYYKPGIVQIPIGLAYGQCRINTYISRLRINSNGILRFNKNIDTVDYAGYGTLVLNGATFDNCVLIRHRRVTTDTLGANPRYTTIWNWFTNQLPYPLLQFSITPGSSASVSYVDNIVTRVAPLLGETLNLSPNPAKGFVEVQGSSSTVRLTNAQGVSVQRPVLQGRADLTGLAPGLYLAEYGNRRARLVVE